MAGASSGDIFSGRMFAIVTGASQGLGRSLTVAFASKAATGSVIAIVARNANELEKTAALAKTERSKNGLDDDIEVECVKADLSNLEDVNNLTHSCFRHHLSSDFQSAILVHNVGTLGDISKEVVDIRSPEEVTDYFKLNVAHIPPITGGFLDWTGDTRTVVVNISSLFALQPCPCFALYCSGKAARDMLFRVLAAENSKIKVLNWAPGPLHTDMTETIWSTTNKHNTDQATKKMRDDGKYLTCEQSTNKLLEVLRGDDFVSGSHIDYFDV